MKEIAQRKEEIKGETVQTLYIGGGTPSLLKPEQLGALIECIKAQYIVHEDAEITLEANPDDMDKEYLTSIKETGINRLSIGIQSFHSDDLKLLNRIHDGKQARRCIKDVAMAGFDNLNIDLIYGLPGSDIRKWKQNLEYATGILPGHISAYHLTYEPGSVLNHWKNKNRITAIGEMESLEQFNLLADHLEKHGYHHYEISNFALDGCISKHNMAYWSGTKYLGFGPSAHSFNGEARRWNLAKNSSYIKAIETGKSYFDMEILDITSKFHDYLITHLRASQGVNTEFILNNWGNQFSRHFTTCAKPFIKSGKLLKKDNKFILSREGMFISDHIISGLFMQR